jgi:hypothetical protein
MERDHLAETRDIGRIILKQILKKSVWEGVDLTDLAQYRHK